MEERYMVLGSIARTAGSSSTVDLLSESLYELNNNSTPIESSLDMKVEPEIAIETKLPLRNKSPRLSTIHIQSAPEPLLRPISISSPRGTTNIMTGKMMDPSEMLQSPKPIYISDDDVNVPFLNLQQPALPFIPDYAMEITQGLAITNAIKKKTRKASTSPNRTDKARDD